MANRSGIEIDGIEDVSKRLGAMEDQGKKVESVALRRAGDLIKESVERESPVKSGKLRRSIKRSGVRQDDAGKYVLVWPSAFYAHMVEFGTKHSRANPFIARGYESSKQQALAIIAAEIRRGLGL